MHTLARSPVREASLNRQAGNRAFTLIELLTVIAIIAILAGITFGVVKGVNERAAIGQAKTELAVLAQALEAYKMQYGDYPQTGQGAISQATSTALTATCTQYYLFNALAGKLGPKLDQYAGRTFVELSRFSLESPTVLPAATGSTPVLNSFLDPWGRRYMYYYKAVNTTTWIHPGYILFSVGPDNVYTAPTVTATNYTSANNLDNIYANRN